MNGLVTKETFKGYDTDSKLNTLFDYVEAIHKTSTVADQDMGERIGKLENRKKFDTGLSAVAGIVGGIIAVVGKKLLLR